VMLQSSRKTLQEILGRSPIHPFPARMAPGIALAALGTNRRPLRVLDPMVGSGTALAVARAFGHRAFGFDSDPLAVILARVWTRTITPNHVAENAVEVLSRARERFHVMPVASSYPNRANESTRRFVRYWYDPYARRQLAALSASIAEIEDQTNREVLWCAFSRLIISKQAGASLAMDLSHSRPHRAFERAPQKPLSHFLEAVQTVIANCPHRNAGPVGPATTIRLGDARNLPVEHNSIDLVLTSPPYLNAIDYMRCSKFTLVWMGYNVETLTGIRGNSIGAASTIPDQPGAQWVDSLIHGLRLQPRLADRHYKVLARYVDDMGQAIGEVSRVMRVGGRAVYVVGDSTVRSTFIPNSRLVESLANRHGLTLISKHSRKLPDNRRYLPPPKKHPREGSLHTRMRREVVMVFGK
jgi:tRNA G10  N-methylase Trm11